MAVLDDTSRQQTGYSLKEPDDGIIMLNMESRLVWSLSGGRLTKYSQMLSPTYYVVCHATNTSMKCKSEFHESLSLLESMNREARDYVLQLQNAYLCC